MKPKTSWVNSPYSIREKLDMLKYRILAPCSINHTGGVFEDEGHFAHTFAATEPNFSIGFIGDFMPFGDNTPTLTDELTEKLSALDCLVVNVEGVLTDQHRYLALTHLTDLVERLEQLFPCPLIFNVANNHAADFGSDNFAQHCELLGRNHRLTGVQDQPLMLPEGIALYATTRWSNQPQYATPHFDYQDTERLAAMFADGMFNIFLPHWGYEMHLYPHSDQVNLAGYLLSNHYCDVIVGMHSHVPQPIQLCGNGLVAYSLGNFCYRNVNPNHHFGSLLTLRLAVGEGQKPVLVSADSIYTRQAITPDETIISLTSQLDYATARKETSRGFHFLSDLIK